MNFNGNGKGQYQHPQKLYLKSLKVQLIYQLAGREESLSRSKGSLNLLNSLQRSIISTNIEPQSFNNNIWMEGDKKEILRQLLRRAAENDCFSEAIAQASTSYQIKPYNIQGLSPSKINEIYHTIKSKFYDTNLTNQNDSWYENQLRVFIWVLINYSYLEAKPIENMREADWQYFSQIFNAKNPDTFQFQALCLIKRRKSKKWNTEEIRMLVSIIGAKTEKNKWNEIAKAMFTRSRKKYFRTPKQCREQWINHLDPSKVRCEWSALEDYQLIKAILEVGKKWSLVAKELQNRRTEHMVKNRFKSLLNTQIKRIDYEEKEEALILKIKQRLEANSTIKKYLQASTTIQLAIQCKHQQIKNPQKIKVGSQQIQQSSEDEDEEYCPIICDNIPRERLNNKTIEVQQMEDKSQIVLESISGQKQPPHQELQFGENKAEEVWSWKCQNIDQIHHLNKLFRDKEEENYEEQFNHFFAPIKYQPFKFDF